MEISSLFLNMVLALAAAFLGAVVAVWLRQSLLIGYIVAGVLIGPYTPGFVADHATVAALADLGIVFLLFAVGLHISLRDLLRAGAMTIVGGLVQVVLLVGIGYAAGLLFGWQRVESLFFGAVVAISSTTVLSKVLEERGETGVEYGRLAFAWATVQDLAAIALVVLLTTLAHGSDTLGWELAWELGRAGVFLALLVPVGLFVLPRIYEQVALLRNREVFILAVGATALGAALVASLFGISIALGAFVAGVLVSESDLSHQILGEIEPLRDILAGLFFVSVGMLVDPMFIVQNVLLVAATLVLIVLVKGAVIALLIRLSRRGLRTSVLTGVVLAQAAELSFLLASVGAELEVVGTTAFNAMLAGSALSTILAPPLLSAMVPLVRRLDRPGAFDPGEELPVEALGRRRYAIICGYGRVGQVIGEALARRNVQFVVIDQDPRLVRALREQGVPAFIGNAENTVLLQRAGIERAHALIVAMPDALAARRIVEQVRQHRKDLDVLVRTHSLAELATLQKRGASEAVLGELELALEMTRHTLHRFGVSAVEAAATVNRLRERAAETAQKHGTDAAFWT
ncbi:MAG: cation:proton antiporter [Chloroflexi bacterium]|nr:cation:proton antiporter [Chloroflexota bacterium]